MSDPGDEMFDYDDYPPDFGKDRPKCPICGETDPDGRWFCLPRAVGEALQGAPCAYSIEGHQRMIDRMVDNMNKKTSEIR